MTQYKQKENYEATELDGEWIILNTDKYTVTKINQVGGYCWSLLNQAQTVNSLSRSLIEMFPSIDNEEQIEKDVEEFLHHLIQYGLIQYVD